MTGLHTHDLDGTHSFYAGQLSGELRFGSDEFEQLWQLHPEEFHEIKIHGRPVKTPRWQQAYGADYHYTGRVNKALPVPDILQPLLTWSRQAIASELNGILLNWYDGSHGHYIGKHRDSTKNMIYGAPIVTISLGQERTFRLRPWKENGLRDFQATDGKVFIMPYDTNLAWTHEVPSSKKLLKRRVSVTIRAFGSCQHAQAKRVRQHAGEAG